MRFKNTILALATISYLPFCSLYSESQEPNPSSKEYQSPDRGDFSQMGWHKAFLALHKKLAREYAFTEHKQINWVKLRKQFEKKFVRAERSRNLRLYGLALREFLYSIPDGHLDFEPYDEGEFIQGQLRWEAIGGGFDFSITPLDDGRVIAPIVLDSGVASRVGMFKGAEIVEWNGKPILKALDDQPIFWSDTPIPTL